MKLLLYCTKAKPILRKLDNYFLDKHNDNYYWGKGQTVPCNLNGKIVAECDFEVEEINYRSAKFVCNRYYLEILKKSCLTDKQMYDYLKGEKGYAIHIKNLKIFDKPKELRDYKGDSKGNFFKIIEKAPQNMQMVLNEKLEDCILISIRPQWLCKILNGEKTIEVRKKALMGMVE